MITLGTTLAPSVHATRPRPERHWLCTGCSRCLSAAKRPRPCCGAGSQVEVAAVVKTAVAELRDALTSPGRPAAEVARLVLANILPLVERYDGHTMEGKLVYGAVYVIAHRQRCASRPLGLLADAIEHQWVCLDGISPRVLDDIVRAQTVPSPVEARS